MPAPASARKSTGWHLPPAWLTSWSSAEMPVKPRTAQHQSGMWLVVRKKVYRVAA